MNGIALADVAQRGRGAAQSPPETRALVALAFVVSVAWSASSGAAVAGEPSWIFDRGTYTHDPHTGARVAQYARMPPIEGLADPRKVTSEYNYSRLNLRGMDGSLDTYYQVQAWGNVYGLGAEWERFHDAWKESYIRGGYYDYTSYRPYGPPFYGGFPRFPGPNHRAPTYGIPGYGYGWPQQ